MPGRGIHNLGAYIAKQCPVRLQWDVIGPSDPIREDAGLRAERGVAFENRILEWAENLNDPTWYVLDAKASRPEKEALTLEAMQRGDRVIFDGRLPADPKGYRVGEPDVLVRFGDDKIDARWRYLPVDIKHHRTLELPPEKASKNPKAPALTSSIEAPFWDTATSHTDGMLLKDSQDDAIQLAHYMRMLEACGHAAPEAIGGIIGSEEPKMVVWCDLATPSYTTRSTSDPNKKTAVRSAIERYDHEFAFRVDVMKSADNKAPDDPTLLVEPLHNSDCAKCKWRDYCGPKIEENSGSITLLPRVGYQEWLKHKEVGIETRQDVLNRINLRTAALMTGFTKNRLRKLREDAKTVPPDHPAADLLDESWERERKRLREVKIDTAAEVLKLHAGTIELMGNNPSSTLFNMRIDAEASLSRTTVTHRPFVEVQPPPRFDVEIDVDMENSIDEHVYLWGALLSRDTDDTEYFPFADWDVDSVDGEIELFEKFWGWFYDLQEETVAAGQTFGAYCWNASAENRRLRELSAHDPLLAEQVEDFIASDSWVDLADSFKKYYSTGNGWGLKKVAPLSGFSWRADDAGGDISMSYFEDQATGTKVDSSRQWLLEYNEDDCAATYEVRRWLTSLVEEPSIVA